MTRETDRFPVDAAVVDANVRRMDDLLDGGTNVMVKSGWNAGRLVFFDQPRCREHFEDEFALYLSQYNMDSEAAALGLDNIPYFRVDFCRVPYLIPIAYGARTVDGPGVVGVEPLWDSVESAAGFEKPAAIHERGYYPELARRMREIERRLGPVGFVPGDVQSPVDVLTNLVDSTSALADLCEPTDGVHRLLGIITESIAEIVEHQRGTVRNWLGCGHDYPIGRGIHLSDDNAALLSPAIYAACARPYAERLARRFGGVTLHCCMAHGQCIPEMARTEGFLGFDAQFRWHEDDLVLPHIRGRGFLRQFWIPEGRDPVSFYKEVIDKTDGVCGLLLEVAGETRDEAVRAGLELKEYAARRNRLFSP